MDEGEEEEEEEESDDDDDTEAETDTDDEWMHAGSIVLLITSSSSTRLQTLQEAIFARLYV